MVIKILVLFGTMFLLMMIGSPIAVALGVATMVTMTATTNISLTTMSTACLSGLDSFPLMAIPFFMLAGNLMKSGGISRRILDFADAVVGWVTGSVGMVTVVASMFFAALSGSSPATVTAIGGITIPEMKEEGYDPAYATAITAAAGTIGVIIPPSIPFVIYGVAAQCSISDLFLAGIIPGILIGVVLMIVNYVTAKKHGFGHTKKFHAGHLLRTLGDSIWALLVPVIILGGIYGGIFTPTESAVAAILYSIFVGVFIYHELDLKSAYTAILNAAKSSASVMFLCCCATLFGYCMTVLGLPQLVTAAMTSVIKSPVVFLLGANIIYILCGMFVDATTAILLVCPLLYPAASAFGIDLVQFGVITGINLSMGIVTPPFGGCMFVATGLDKRIKLEDLYRGVIPFCLTGVLGILAVTYIEPLSMFLVSIMK